MFPAPGTFQNAQTPQASQICSLPKLLEPCSSPTCTKGFEGLRSCLQLQPRFQFYPRLSIYSRSLVWATRRGNVYKQTTCTHQGSQGTGHGTQASKVPKAPSVSEASRGSSIGNSAGPTSLKSREGFRCPPSSFLNYQMDSTCLGFSNSS